MLWRDNIYTVHENPALDALEDRVVLVREGFSFWAFAFTIFWLLGHRLWRMSAIFAVIAIALAKGGEYLHLPHPTMLILQAGLDLWIGLIAYDAQRAALARSGYALTGVVCANSALMAERRYYDTLATAS